MNKEFKVGQRVWSFVHKKIMWVSEITSTGCFLADNEKLLINYYHANNEFHQTADDMFEELGYKPDISKHEIIYRNIFTSYPVFNIVINLINKSYKFCDRDEKVSYINIDIHLAIHQKLIELE